MGESRNRSRSQKAILGAAERCIYCDAPATSIEHMPPLAMFRERNRPSGMEYPACVGCNNGTSAADLVASCMAHVSPFDRPNDWRTKAIQGFLRVLRRKAPGLAAELMRPDKSERQWVWSPEGLLRPSFKIDADGPILKAHLDVFAAKLGMALFHEHLGKPLPLDGLVFATWFLNAGLTQAGADSILSMLPIHGELRQGQKTVQEQFTYRYNTDDAKIVAAFCRFHNSFYVFTIATSNEETFGPLRKFPNFVMTKPGALRRNGGMSDPE